MDDASQPGVFGGVIADGGNWQTNKVLSLTLGDDDDVDAVQILTGQNAFTGGTTVQDGCLQIGDGTTNGLISGEVTVSTQDGLIFDVSGSSTVETFDGVISPGDTPGSVLKEGPGELDFTGSLENNSSVLLGELRVDDGEWLFDPQSKTTSTPVLSSLFIDNGATVDLGTWTVAFYSVTLDNGRIISSGVNGTLEASDSFNLANTPDSPNPLGQNTPGLFDLSNAQTTGITANVTLTGTASINKRTDGVVDIYGRIAVQGGIFVDQGTLNYYQGAPNYYQNGTAPTTEYVAPGATCSLFINGTTSIAQSSAAPVLYWAPDWIPHTNEVYGGTGYWEPATDTTDKLWVTIIGTQTLQTSWQDGAVAVFQGSPGEVTVEGDVQPAAIEIDSSNFDIEDGEPRHFGFPSPGSTVPSGLTMYLDVSAQNSLVVTVPTGVAAELGAIIIGFGSITKEGDGALQLNGVDVQNNNSDYAGGTFIDAGTVTLGGGGYALGGNEYLGTYDDTTDLTVDDTGELNLAGQTYLDVTSLNSSYAQSGAPDGVITGTATLNVIIASTPGVFGGSIEGDIALSLQSDFTSPPTGGLLMTLTGDNTSNGDTLLQGAMQLGDGYSNGSIEKGSIQSADNTVDVVVDVNNSATPTTPETFANPLDASNSLISLVKTGPGTLELTGNNLFNNTADYGGTLCVLEGDVELGSAAALPGNSSVVVDNGATLDLQGNSLTGAWQLKSLTLNYGTIIDSTNSGATLEVTGLIEVGQGIIAVNLAGPATFVKVPGSGVIPWGSDIIPDTVVLGGADSYLGTTIVLEGELRVNGSLSGPVIVGPTTDVGVYAISAVLGGEGTCSGTVTVEPDGTLAMDGLVGPGFTIGNLVLEPGCQITEAENLQTGMLEAVQVIGTLTVNGGSVTFPDNYPNLLPFQVLFRYGAQAGVTFATPSSLPSGVNSFCDDTSANTIELYGSNVLFWDPGSNPVPAELGIGAIRIGSPLQLAQGRSGAPTTSLSSRAPAT